jgi:hypothetical protein
MHADNGIKPNNKKQQLQPLAISKRIKQLLKKTETLYNERAFIL